LPASRVEIMRGLVGDKFERHPKLAAQLRATAGRELIRPAGPWGQRRSMLLGLVFGGGIRGWALRAVVVLVALRRRVERFYRLRVRAAMREEHSCAPRMIPGATLLRNLFAPTSPPASRTP
jgi:hypothetical protein